MTTEPAAQALVGETAVPGSPSGRGDRDDAGASIWVLAARRLRRNPGAVVGAVIVVVFVLVALLLSGAVLTQTVFAFNGIGSFLADAIFSLDYAVLQGFILFAAVVYALANLAVDVSYGLIDPRMRAR